jgi:hypothetical protein
MVFENKVLRREKSGTMKAGELENGEKAHNELKTKEKLPHSLNKHYIMICV